MKIPELGIGLTYHRVLDQVIENHADLIQVLEIEPQTHWVQPDPFASAYDIDQVALGKIQSFPAQKLLHGIGFPVGGSRLPDEIEYPLLRAMIDALSVPWMSEHLSFNKAHYGGREYVTNYMLPPLQTPEGVAAAASTIRTMQAKVPIPLAVETGVNYLRPIVGQLSDGEFTRQVTEQADCGILLDLHNILTNQINGRQSMGTFLAEIPLERVVELHVAGGKMRGGYYIDSHSTNIPQTLLELAEKLLPSLPNLGAIIFEIFPDYLAGIGSELVEKDLKYLNRLWERRKKTRKVFKPESNGSRVAAPQAQPGSGRTTPREWEDNLAALVTRQSEVSAIEELRDEPAIALIRDLIESFRASMVSESFRYTARLLMIHLGIEEYDRLLAEFWKQSPPEPFASTEGSNFVRYVESSDLRILGLREVIAFERAYIATLIDGKERVVSFPFDPLSFMKALGEGRKPHKVYEGNYELAIESRPGLIAPTFHHRAVAH